jgi:hypothetical protein
MTTRAFQSLPRHLRRRAASHNPRRVPKRLRDKATFEVSFRPGEYIIVDVLGETGVDSIVGSGLLVWVDRQGRQNSEDPEKKGGEEEEGGKEGDQHHSEMVGSAT